MGSYKRGAATAGASLNRKFGNKIKRQSSFINHKKATGKTRHEERHRRRKEENQDPEIRRARLERNKPASLDAKRIWDDDMDDDSLGAVVDVAAVKRRRLDKELAEGTDDLAVGEAEQDEADEEDRMLGSDDDGDSDNTPEEDGDAVIKQLETIRNRRNQRDESAAPSVAPSVAPSTTSTSFDLTPESLLSKFPTLFSEEPLPFPKILVTTSLNATIHLEAQQIAALFPNSKCP